MFLCPVPEVRGPFPNPEFLPGSAETCGRRTPRQPQLPPHRGWQCVPGLVPHNQPIQGGGEGRGIPAALGPSMGLCSGLGGSQPDTTLPVRAPFSPGRREGAGQLGLQKGACASLTRPADERKCFLSLRCPAVCICTFPPVPPPCQPGPETDGVSCPSRCQLELRGWHMPALPIPAGSSSEKHPEKAAVGPCPGALGPGALEP